MECEHTQWVEVEQGTTIKGEHLHVYKCSQCGMLDIGTEQVILEEDMW